MYRSTRAQILLISLLIYTLVFIPLLYKVSLCTVSSLEREKVRLEDLALPTEVSGYCSRASTVAIHEQSQHCSECAVWRKGTSKWFDDRYNSSTSPIWTIENRELEETVRRWWMKIQFSNNPERLPKIWDDLFQIIPFENPYKLGDPSRCLRCAIVGNSGNLRNSKYGKLIDGHDYVMRINQGITKGFEEDVGNRTTHRFIYPESFHEVKGETRFVLLAFKPLDLEWLISALTIGDVLRNYKLVDSSKNITRSMVQVYNPALMYHTSHSWTENHGRYPSTGMLVIAFAMQACDQINLFGYGATGRGNWDHYFDKPQPPHKEKMTDFRKTGVHDGGYEAIVIKKLEKIGKITVFRGSRS
ncbi:CMP-N-acetylneuraminate-beta-galactosamide-alpha-2,3-sialyltransferase 2-like [Glandiceps talaboti]